METQQQIDFNRIAASIAFIKEHFKSQPSLEQIADHVNLSPFHLQRMFQDWAGVSPKKFVQYLTVEHAKSMLKENRSTLFDAAYESGLSGTGRLHDLFVNIEGMTPGEYKNGGAALTVSYSFAPTLFGDMIVASTHTGICYMAFVDEGRDIAFERLSAAFPNARYQQSVDHFQQNVLSFFDQDWNKIKTVKLHLRGTPFQIKVWETLLQIPAGTLTTYAQLAERSGNRLACRAVGSAVGANPIALLIPCHRVIRSTGEIGNYHWGSARKQAIIGWEAIRSAYHMAE
ncbi:methylated-DNA--[protein]-cysteine S-methyltransferase [Olivibacter sp. XZL3]|uniref:methylated-DNA--[protein]-cysteine S-methyltransferase n=1 Tax=Olivibacter sp. XZL3 TaxID=1735116 RepID=UPI001065110F|nr:methylated-DNA--[protein]-cysteine S-methyltransferase [Olivibacter sp. XZL3]